MPENFRQVAVKLDSGAQPLVSTIIPCYNAKRFVGEAIESALAQTYSPVEVIVIDDGSTDGSLEVIRGFGEAVRWESGPNRGGCAARNRGLELARGELIQFLDADDLLHPDKLQVQIPHSLADASEIVFCRWATEFMSEGAGHLKCSEGYVEDSIVYALQHVISTSAPLYPVELLRAAGGWDENLSCAQDFELNLRLACSGVRFRQIPDVLITFRRVNGSVSSDMVRVLRAWKDIYWTAYRQLEARGEMTDERAAAFAAGFAAHGRRLLRYGLTAEAAERFADARQMHPSGGIPQTYRPWTRVLRRLCGPVMTERIVEWKRSLQGQGAGAALLK